MKKIATYNEHYTDVQNFYHQGKYDELVHNYRQPNDINKFFKQNGRCRFCNSELKKVFEGYLEVPDDRDSYLLGDIFECPQCGWWEGISKYTDMPDNPFENIQSYHENKYYYGIVNFFDLSSKELPLEVLYNELNKNKQILYDINPYKSEELVQSVLSDFFDCEVKHVGQTGDGGKDLIVVQSEHPILVQVKRRENPNHVELIKGIREFVGTLFIEGSKKGIYVSTAKKFSKGSIEVANELVNNRKLEYFNLIDYDKLVSMLNIEKNIKKPWEEFAKQFEFDTTKWFGAIAFSKRY